MMRSETVAQPGTALHEAVGRVLRELAAHPADLPDRVAAEEELMLIDAMAVGGTPDVGRLRGSLLLVAAALGSVSALRDALADLRAAVDAFGA